MKQLKVHLTQPKGHPFPIVSWLIRLESWLDSSHAVLELPTEKIFHSRFDETLVEQRLEWEKSAKVMHTYVFYMDDDRYEEMVEWIVTSLGKRHGFYVKLFGAWISRSWYKLTGKRIQNPFYRSMNHARLCSEYIRHILKNYTTMRIPTYPYGNTFSVKDLKILLEDNKAKKIFDRRD